MSDTLDFLARERCSAILRTPHADAVAPAMRAAIEGGFRVVEFTLNTPGALDHIAEFARDADLLVGAGTVLSVDDAERARTAGAKFLVAPHTDPEVIGYAKKQGLVSIPGTMTPTEMMTAHRAGADLVKLFPAPPGGPAYVKAVLGPLPFLKVFPTSGVTLDNCGEFMRAGAFGIGFVAPLFDPDDMANARFEAIRARAAQMVDAVQSASA